MDFSKQLIEIEWAFEEIAGRFSLRSTVNSSHKKPWLPVLFRGAYLPNLASHQASRNPTHKNL